MRDAMEAALKDMGLSVETDGTSYVYTTQGRYAPVISVIITPDDDLSAATIMATLSDKISPEQRPAVYELFNLVHGQNIWNVRFHVDETGRVLAIGKFQLWGRPFHAVQFGDVLFSLLVSADRLFPCLSAIQSEKLPAVQAFERFFVAGRGEN